MQEAEKKITVPELKSRKNGKGPRISMLTGYDFPTAQLLDEAGIDAILVGDSLATVMWGHATTVTADFDEMLPYLKSVSRAVKRALVVGDLPFGSYQVSPEKALESAFRFMKEGGAHAIKLEGGVEVAATVKRLTQSGIPVMGHIGLTPQSFFAMGSYRMHGKEEAEKEHLLKSALALEEAGAFAIVLECVEETLSKKITEALKIPTIGIGSGNVCDGEVLVIHDLVGLTPGKTPKFVKPEENLREPFKKAIERFISRTREGANR